uniref:Uncharacterized protein n=1 Tax=Anguilla anguilla TaxID=7936 RepID=A0A0E9PYI9_ANGAN
MQAFLFAPRPWSLTQFSTSCHFDPFSEN